MTLFTEMKNKLKTEEEITFDVIKECIYDNPMYLMLSWCDRNKCYNNYSI